MARAMNPFTFDGSQVTNYQRAIVRFRREPDLIPMGAYLTNMQIIADERISTACTDCVRIIRYNPKFFETLTVEECTSVLIHEAYHKFLNFFPRFERWAKRHSHGHNRGELLRVFNEAQDYFINYIIKHNWNLPLGSGWLYDAKLDADTKTTEMIADHLLANPQARPPQGSDAPDKGEGDGDPDAPPQGNNGPDEDSGDSPGDDGDSGDDPAAAGSSDDGDEDGSDADGSGAGGDTDDTQTGDGEAEAGDVGEGDDIMLPEEYKGDINNTLSESEMREIETQNRQDISQSLRAARGYGAGDGNDPFSGDASDAAFEATFDFERELNKWANASAKHGKYTWQRTHRKRRTSQGFVFPTRKGKEIGTAVFIIDSSGSTDGPMVRYFLDEVTEALRHVNYKRAVVVWCSDDVVESATKEFTKAEADGLQSLFDGRIYRAGYGTNFPPAFEYVAENYPDTRCITYLTDGGVGEWDVEESAKIVREKLNDCPVLWALANEYDWEFVKRFRDWVRQHRIGYCADLPMEKVNAA